MTTAVRFLTHDDDLWQRWNQLDATRWEPLRLTTLAALTGLAAEVQQDVVVVDAGLAGLPVPGTDAWQAQFAGLKVVVADTNPTDEKAARAITAGAMGYIHAYLPPASLAVVFEQVLAGQVWLGEGLMQRLLRMIQSRVPQAALGWDARLTPRERAVAERAALGDSNLSIADELGITERTVKAHLSAVFEKLDVPDRLALTLKIHGIARPQA